MSVSDLTAEEQQLAALRDEVSPAKAVDRIANNAKFIVGSIGLVAAGLTFLGLTTASRVGVDSWATALAYVGVGLAVLAAMLAFATTITGVAPVRPGNLLEYRKVMSKLGVKGRILRAAGALLILAVALVTGAAALALGIDREPRLQLAVDALGAVHIAVVDEDESEGSTTHVELRGRRHSADAADGETVLLRQTVSVGEERSITLARDLELAEHFAKYQLTYVDAEGDEHRAELNGLPLVEGGSVALQRVTGAGGTWSARATIELEGRPPGAQVVVSLLEDDATPVMRVVGEIGLAGRFSSTPEAVVSGDSKLTLVVELDGREIERAEIT